MDTVSSQLHSAFVGAFEQYLKEILTERSLPTLPDQTVADARQWLDESLAQLLELPYPEQRRSPLEIMQEAMSGPTEALAQKEVRAPLRDPMSVAALPGDIYGIAPASSAALGESAFEAHLAWGIQKARALAPLVTGRGRRVALVSGDLMDRSKFEEAVNGAGMKVQAWRKSEGPMRPVVAFVDITHPEADEAIRTLASDQIRVIAYGPHVDEDAMARAATLGASLVLSRSRLFRTIGEHLPRLT